MSDFARLTRIDGKIIYVNLDHVTEIYLVDNVTRIYFDYTFQNDIAFTDVKDMPAEFLEYETF